MTEVVLELKLDDEAATVMFGRVLAIHLRQPALVFLEGDLGVGKTTLCRGLLQGLGHEGAVKSPTYTLVEPYALPGISVYHFDLYRLFDPEELEYLGFRDYLNASALVLVEWPSKGVGLLPEPDLRIELSAQGEGRRISLRAGSTLGRGIIADIRSGVGLA